MGAAMHPLQTSRPQSAIPTGTMPATVRPDTAMPPPHGRWRAPGGRLRGLRAGLMAVVMFGVAAGWCPAEVRTITSADGNQLEARILKVEDGQVTLVRVDDDREFTLPLARLSEKDQEFLRDWRPAPRVHEPSVSEHGISDAHGLAEYQADKHTFDEGRFHIYVPESYHSDTPMPLVVSSHGSGSNGGNEIRAWQALADEHGFIVLCPSYDGATANGLEPKAENTMELIEELMPKVFGSFNIDRDHVMHTGFSGGGHPTFYALNFPDWFTALCFRSPNFTQSFVERAVPTRNLRQWRGRPVYFFWGTEDTAMITESSPRAIEFLEGLRVELETEHIEGGGHDSHPARAAEWFAGLIEAGGEAAAEPASGLPPLVP